MSTNPKKKEILNVRLTHLHGDTPDTLRVVAQARAALGLYDQPEKSDRLSDDTQEFIPVAPIAEKDKTPMVPLESMADGLGAQEAAGLPAESIPGQKGFFAKAADFLGGVIPKRGDPPLEILRKCIFNIALITLIVSLSYIINDMIIIPMRNQQKYDSLTQLYNPDNPAPPPADFPEEKYPEGIMDAFKALYAKNDQIRGWMTYRDSNKKWLNINYPVMYSGDNKYYLDHDFQKAKNKNGALFFDERNNLETPHDTNRVLIIYGHNMASGQMLSPLNIFLNNLNYMRSAPVINLDTLFDRREYKVFSVMLLSTRKEDGPYFDYLRTSFADDEDFMDFVANIRARSIYDFKNVDIRPDDQLLILSTCTTTSGAKFKDGRCVVVARKVRSGESVAIRPSDIVKNDDVIMPYAWYVNQKKTPHKYYTDSNYTIPGAPKGNSGSSYYPTSPTTYDWKTGSQTNPTGSITAPGGSNPSGTAPGGSGTKPSGTDATSPTGTGSETSATGTGSGTEPTETSGDPTGTEPTEPEPTDTEPTEPEPTEPEPTEPEPTEPEPTEEQ